MLRRKYKRFVLYDLTYIYSEIIFKIGVVQFISEIED